MYRKICSSALSLVALLALSSAAHAQNKIGWNFDGSNTSLDAMLPGDLAGFIPQTNWNNHASNGQGPGNVPFALVNDLGLASGASVTAFTLVTNNSWHIDEFANPNEKLMNSFADSQPSITFSGIPASFLSSGYSLYVYYANNEGPSTSTLTISGSINDSFTRSIRTGDEAVSYRAVGFRQELGLLPTATTPSNFTVFTGLNDPNVTVSLAGLNNNGITAVQIVAVPEPASVGLIVLGAAALGLRRRRH